MNKLIPKVRALLLTGCSLGLNATLFADEPPLPPTPSPDAPLVELLATDPTALVGASSGAFTVIRTGSTDADLKVQYAISGTASNGVDYASIETVVTIPAGFLAADIVIQPVSPPPTPGNKKVTLTLQPSADYRLDKRGSATLMVLYDVYNNKPPTVSLTAPKDGDQFNLPAIVTLQATASDPDDKVQRVSFYADDRYLGRGTNDPAVPDGPFTLSWTNPPPGTNAIFARAVDELGKSTLSAPVHIIVNANAPTVTITSPKEGDVLAFPANVKIEAEVAKGSGAIVRVQLYGDHRLLGTPANAPYSADWNKVPVGTHTATVRVTDEFGLTATATVHFKVENQAPIVDLIQPKAGDNFAARSDITLTATASDPDGAIKQVSFWANNRYLGSITKAPYTLVWKKVPAGAFSLKATATDEYGLKTASSPVLISVSK